ncbi:TPA: MFS transporter [Escherichia coli]|nr:MFS transporter [Escherichia coli]
MLSIFKPAPHKARLPAAEIDPTYRRLRWQIFLGIFFGYAAYYLVRKNFALAMPYLVEQGFSRGDLGFALSGISIAYGFSKFIMGSVSDRSNPRVFLPAGLILAAAVMLFMGFVPWATSSIAVMFVLLFLCGWFQGMGWPPCGRTMVHWWSQKERGGIVSVWNCAHNVGGGIYVRHIYVKTEGKAEAGFLDLEKSRRRLRRDKAINHDFRQLEKYLEPIPKADWEQVKAYYYAM